MKKIILLFIIMLLGCQSNTSKNSLRSYGNKYYAQKTESLVFVNTDKRELPYRLFLPENYTRDIEYPLVLSFHGSGERGNDNLNHLEPWVAGWIDKKVQKKNPCIILMPQCPIDMKWVEVPWENGSYSFTEIPLSQPMQLVKKLLDKTIKEYSVDKKRIYVMGASMGGFATWNFISNFPELPAAAVPVCGAGDPSFAERIHTIPIWAFHGDKDVIVPLTGTTDMINALTKYDNHNARMTIYKNVGHESYNMAWKDSNLLEWVFEQRK